METIDDERLDVEGFWMIWVYPNIFSQSHFQAASWFLNLAATQRYSEMTGCSRFGCTDSATELRQMAAEQGLQPKMLVVSCEASQFREPSAHETKVIIWWFPEMGVPLNHAF